MWSYFEFDKHWNQFLQEWHKPHIQDILFRDLMDFSISSGLMYPWQRGEPVWYLTPSNHWDIIVDQKVNIKIQEENLKPKFINSFHNATGYLFKGKNDSSIKFHHIVYHNIRNEFFPKPNSLESLVLIGGNNAISYAMYRIAIDMFEHTEVTSVFDEEGHMWILLPNEKIVFDIEGYYMFTRCRDHKYDISLYSTFLDNLLYWSLDSESNDSVS